MKNKKEKTKDDKETPKPVNIISTPETIKGVYSNTALVYHSKNEFVIDFMLNAGNTTQLVSRVILSPAHMSDFKNALQGNYQKYVEKFLSEKNQRKTTKKSRKGSKGSVASATDG